MCTKCELPKPVADFSRRSSNKDGLCKWCKLCFAEYRRDWRRNNADKEKQHGRTYRSTHSEQIRDKLSRYRARRKGALVERVSRKAVFERDGWICQICHLPVYSFVAHPDPFSKSLDHIIALSNGGAHCYSNVQLAHLVCNERKNAR